MADLPTTWGEVALVRAARQADWRRAVLGLDRGGPALGALLLIVGVPWAYAFGWLDLATVNQLGRYCALGLVAVGLDLVWGYAGVLSLCQAMFFTIGGYAMGMHLAMHGPLDGGGIPRALFVVSSEVSGMSLPWFWKPFDSFPLSLGAALLVPGVVAFLFGWFSFRSRIRGVYFSIISQAATIALWLLFCRNELRLCGTNGLTNFSNILGFPLSSPDTKLGLYVASAVLLCSGAWAVAWLAANRFGRVLVAVRDSEMRLRFAGWQPVAFKTAAFVISAMLAGLGGALYAPQNGIVTPANMTAVESILVVVWVAVGGRGTITGAVVGALGINLLYASLTTHLPRLWPFVLGAVFVAAVLFLPDGIVGLWRRLTDRLRGVRP